MANFLIQGQTTWDSSGPISSIIEIIQALVVMYILTKFGDDWLIFVDASVLISKLWTDGQRRTMSDHNSSLSTPCSGELKRRKCWLPAFSPFPTMFSKGFYTRVVKSGGCAVKSYKGQHNTCKWVVY